MGNGMSAPGADVYTQKPQPAGSPPPRLQVAPLLRRLLWALLLPVGLALLVDWQLGSLPWVTLAVALICIPLASVVVGRAALRDFERVLAVVAPLPAAQPDAPDAPDASVAPESNVAPEALPVAGAAIESSSSSAVPSSLSS